MDRDLKQEVELLTKKLESVLEIVMEHFHENEERLEAVEEKLEALCGISQDVPE